MKPLDPHLIHRVAPSIFRFPCERHAFAIAAEQEDWNFRLEHESGMLLTYSFDWRDRSVSSGLKTGVPSGPSFPLWYLPEALGCSREEYVDDYVHQRSPEERLARLLELEAAAVRATIKPTDWSDAALIGRARARFQSTIEDDNRQLELAQLRRDAEPLWQSKDLAGYVGLLRDHECALPARELRRLRYAMSRLQGR
ncbi:MAG: hypothetical protein ACYS26_17005 [Planctomycetota bacterium]